MRIYGLIIDLLPAWLLALMALVVSAGYILRLRQCAPFWLPRSYYVFGALGWGQLALFYILNALGVLTYVQGVAMTRITFVILMTNELSAHAYVLLICRYLSKRATSLIEQNATRKLPIYRAAGAEPTGHDRPGDCLDSRRVTGKSRRGGDTDF